MFPSSTHAALAALACWAALCAGALEAGAAEPWLRSTSTGSCAISAGVLAGRVREATLGKPNPDLQVEVAISGAVRTRALVRLSLASRTIGTKQLEAATCDEVIDAIVVVVAFALSSESEPAVGTPSSPASPPAAMREELTQSRGWSESGALSEPPLRRPVAPADGLVDLGHEARRWRVSLGVGADRGSLSDATLVVRAGAAARLGAGELRGVATYGVPDVREEVSDIARSERDDFGAAALDYCHGVDPERWVSVCAGLELVVRRYARAEQVPDQPRFEAERFEASPSVVGGLAFVYRDTTVQPGFDAMAHRPLLGALAEGPRLGFRAAFSAALQF